MKIKDNGSYHIDPIRIFLSQNAVSFLRLPRTSADSACDHAENSVVNDTLIPCVWSRAAARHQANSLPNLLVPAFTSVIQTQLTHTHIHTQLTHTQLTHTHNLHTHTQLTHTHTQLTHHNLLTHTHNLLSHYFLTRNFPTHNLLTHNLFTHLCTTKLAHSTSQYFEIEASQPELDATAKTKFKTLSQP